MSEQRHHPRTGKHRQALPDQLPGAVQPLSVRGRAFHQEGRGAGVFATGGEALEHPRDHDQQRRAHADGSVVRREGDQRDRHRHQADDHLHRGLAAFAVRYMPSKTPPTGRMKKPTPKVASAISRDAYSSSEGKNSRAMIWRKGRRR